MPEPFKIPQEENDYQIKVYLQDAGEAFKVPLIHDAKGVGLYGIFEFDNNFNVTKITVESVRGLSGMINIDILQDLKQIVITLGGEENGIESKQFQSPKKLDKDVPYEIEVDFNQYPLYMAKSDKGDPKRKGSVIIRTIP